MQKTEIAIVQCMNLSCNKINLDPLFLTNKSEFGHQETRLSRQASQETSKPELQTE